MDCVRQGRRTTRGATTVAGAPAVDRKPWVTYTIIALNVAVYLVTVVLTRSIMNNGSAVLERNWELFPPAVAAGQWWRLVTSGFVHFGLIHIGVNMASLWFIGRDLERFLGPLRYSVLYALSLLGGSAGAYLLTFAIQTPSGLEYAASGGASGAIFGVFGGILILVLRLKINPRQVIILLVVNLVFSFSVPHISWQAHIGGLITGALFAAAVVYAPAARRRMLQSGAAIVLLLVVLGLFALRDAQLGPTVCNATYTLCQSRT
ncbi:MAG: rhomboid family intramembrane serine protease [Sciscionella sp.]